MEIMVVEADWHAGTTVIHHFGEDRDAAFTFLHEREKTLAADPSKRVCFFRAGSIDELRHTHGSWFYPSVTEVMA